MKKIYEYLFKYLPYKFMNRKHEYTCWKCGRSFAKSAKIMHKRVVHNKKIKGVSND